jgi:hypothetical protein
MLGASFLRRRATVAQNYERYLVSSHNLSTAEWVKEPAGGRLQRLSDYLIPIGKRRWRAKRGF